MRLQPTLASWFAKSTYHKVVGEKCKYQEQTTKKRHQRTSQSSNLQKTIMASLLISWTALNSNSKNLGKKKVYVLDVQLN